MKNAWKLFNYGDTPIYLKYWFLGLILFVPIPWVISIFIAILVHELAHVSTAKKLGYSTKYVFIDLFHGGALVDTNYTKNNKHTISIAFAGPFSNLILSGIGFVIAVILHSMFGISTESQLISYLSIFISINLLLFFVNLIPIYPLDGGRISKSLFRMIFGKKRGQIINAVVSIILASTVLTYSVIVLDYVMLVFAAIFTIASFKELKYEDGKSIN